MNREAELERKIAELEERIAAEQRKNQQLETQLEAEREAALDQRFTLVENSLRLLELKESLEAEQEKSAKLLRNLLPERVIAAGDSVIDVPMLRRADLALLPGPGGRERTGWGKRVMLESDGRSA